MADFKLKRTIWLHNRPWSRGSEDALLEAGFTHEQRNEQLRRRAIVEVADTTMVPKVQAAAFDATDEAESLAAEHGIDLSQLNGSGPNGRIYKRDVQDILDARAELESEDAAG